MPESTRYRFGEFEFDAGRFQLLKDGEALRHFLPLMRRRTRGLPVVSVESLWSALWPPLDPDRRGNLDLRAPTRGNIYFGSELRRRDPRVPDAKASDNKQGIRRLPVIFAGRRKHRLRLRSHTSDGGVVQGLTEGSTATPLTSNGRQNIQPVWSPDGQLIAYHEMAGNGIWIVRPDVHDLDRRGRWSISACCRHQARATKRISRDGSMVVRKKSR